MIKKHPKRQGIKFFQHKNITWSNLNRGSKARIKTIKAQTTITLKKKKQVNTTFLKIHLTTTCLKKNALHPPKNNKTKILENINIVQYSPKKKRAKPVEEYSV